MLRLPEKRWFILGRAGLNVTTNGTLSDSCLMDVSRAWLRGIRRTLFISCWMKQCLYSLLMRCVVSALGRLWKKSSVEQILLSLNATRHAVRDRLFNGRMIWGDIGACLQAWHKGQFVMCRWLVGRWHQGKGFQILKTNQWIWLWDVGCLSTWWIHPDVIYPRHVTIEGRCRL